MLPQRRGDRVARHDGDRQPAAALEQVAEQGQAVHHGHLEVGEDRVDALGGEDLERLLAVGRGQHRKRTGTVQGPGQGAAHKGVVVDEQ